MSFSLTDHPHRRYNLLTGEWVLVSPHRAKRPWQGQTEATPPDQRPAHDPTCYLCPGNPRANGQVNPPYQHTFVFTNDFAALHPDVPPGKLNKHDLLRAESETGLCRVICFSPRHDLTLPELSLADLRRVVDLWVVEFIALASRDDIRYVQIFENKGAVMGCSNPHPHGQIWASGSIPVEIKKETAQMRAWHQQKGSSLLGNYLALELVENQRVVLENLYFVAVVPFWATWPFETMIISKRHIQHITQLSVDEKNALAEMLQQLTIMYDNLFQTSFPYSAGIHQAPVDGQAYPEWHWHMHFYPPLLRSATVKKFMVGYELLAGPQRDISPELAAQR
ncbi:MAG: UDP-glucose--hexose-1-phosphate uridylyltransferase, partial [Bernardetiaceae bacterium]|nr:UDP-glucose--hexose-1-phosphate uridylyltransferase [Bernardetiaceae bacterium]